MEDEKLQQPSASDEFAEMEKMLSDAREKLAQFQQKQAEKQKNSGTEPPKKTEKPKDNPFRELCDSLPEDQFPLGYSSGDNTAVALPMGEWHRLEVYIGRKSLTRRVLGNLMEAAKHCHMQVVVLRRKLFTEFKTGVLFQHAGLKPGDASYWNGDAAGMEILTKVLHREIVNQNVFRDEYCQANGISPNDPQRGAKASGYIRQHTRPLLVVFESVGDLTRAGASEDIQEALRLYLTASGAYNLCFAGFFSPDDGEKVWNHPLAQAFSEAGNVLRMDTEDREQEAGSLEKSGGESFILEKGQERISGTMPEGSLRTDLDEFADALQELMQATKAYGEEEEPPIVDAVDP